MSPLPAVVDLAHLATIHGRVSRPEFDADVPIGHRLIAAIHEVVWSGERLQAVQHGVASADWLVVSGTGLATIDCRMTLRCSDGAAIYVQYAGRADWSEGLGSRPAYITPTFETGDARYDWLNGVVAVGKGHFSGAKFRYEVYELY